MVAWLFVSHHHSAHDGTIWFPTAFTDRSDRHRQAIHFHHNCLFLDLIRPWVELGRLWVKSRVRRCLLANKQDLVGFLVFWCGEEPMDKHHTNGQSGYVDGICQHWFSLDPFVPRTRTELVDKRFLVSCCSFMSRKVQSCTEETSLQPGVHSLHLTTFRFYVCIYLFNYKQQSDIPMLVGGMRWCLVPWSERRRDPSTSEPWISSGSPDPVYSRSHTYMHHFG